MMVVDGVDVLEVREAAAYVSRSAETVRRWVWSGRLPAQRRGNRLLVARRDLDALLLPTTSAPLTLAEWTAGLPSTGTGANPGASAADLVLDDRGARAGR